MPTRLNFDRILTPQDDREIARRGRIYAALTDRPDSLTLAELREMADTENPEMLHPLIEEMLRRLEVATPSGSPEG